MRSFFKHFLCTCIFVFILIILPIVNVLKLIIYENTKMSGLFGNNGIVNPVFNKFQFHNLIHNCMTYVCTDIFTIKQLVNNPVMPGSP